MAGTLKRILEHACFIAVTAAAALAAPAALAGNDKPLFVSVGDVARAPIGWVEFCVEYKGECATKPTTPRDVVLSPKAWTDLVRVNAWVNDNIKPMTDLEHWGVVERWNYPDDGYGDCEDYVLLKRRMLMQAGWPREALLITVVRDKKAKATPCSRSKPTKASSSSTIRKLRFCFGRPPATAS